jgi:hypothetical protein
MARNYNVTQAQKTVLGQAAVILFQRDANGQPYNGIPVGLMENGVTLNHAVSNVDIPDSFSGGMGTAEMIGIQKSASITGNLIGLRRDILAALVHGDYTAVSAGVSVVQTITVYPNQGIYLLDHPNVSSVVVDDGGGPAVPYTLTDDYTINSEWGSLNIVSGGAIDTAAAGGSVVIQVTYDHSAYDLVDALTTGTPERWVRLDGVNVADNLNPYTLDLFRCAIDPLASMPVIAQAVANPAITLNCLADGFRATGSPYYKLKFV